MSKKNSQGTITIETMTMPTLCLSADRGRQAETSIADIPRTMPTGTCLRPHRQRQALALEAHRQGKTIWDTRLIERLRKFRLEAEDEADIGLASLASIETTLGLALADIAQALGIHEPEDMLRVLGPETYLAVYWDPIPYRPAHPPHHKVRLLLARLRDTWPGRWRGKVEMEPA